MKYKLINTKSKEEHFCDKITIDGFDYYVSESEPIKNDWFLHKTNADCSLHICIHRDGLHVISNNNTDYFSRYCKVIIATTNPNIDVPQIADEVEELADDVISLRIGSSVLKDGFVEGYNKAKETHSFSEDDMIEFCKWVNQPHSSDSRQPTAMYVENIDMWWHNHKKYTSKELLQLWKEQKLTTLYYE